MDIRSLVLPAVLVAALLSACVAALLVASAEEAEASFPGKNGRIAFTAYSCDPQPEPDVCDDSEIFTMYPDGTGRKQVTFNGLTDEYPAFSPDGRMFALDRDRNRPLDYEIYTKGPGVGPTNLTNSLGSDRQPTFSPDGAKIAFQRDGDIWVMDADGTNQTQLTENTGEYFEPNAESSAWSPDGTKIAFAEWTYDANGIGDVDIYTIDADGTDPVRLTEAPRFQYDPAWSPDGARIAFTSTRDGDGEIWTMAADGTDQTNLTDNVGLNEFDPAWSPNGRRVAFGGFRSGDQEIFTIGIDGTGWKNITNTPGIKEDQPDWGPAPAP
jgi:Tol biopolymer transport system component